MKEDSKVILEHLQIDNELALVHMSNGGSTENFLEEFYSELDLETMDKLYELYEMDFLLFDYSPDDYYAFVKNKE